MSSIRIHIPTTPRLHHLGLGNKGHCHIALHRVHEIQKLLFLKYLMVSNDFVAVNLFPSTLGCLFGMSQTGCPQFERENLRAKMLRFSGFRAKVFLAPSAFARKPFCRWWPVLTCLRRNLGKSPSTPSQMVTNNHKWKTNGHTFDHGQFHDRIIILKLSLFGRNIYRKIHIAISIFKVITKA